MPSGTLEVQLVSAHGLKSGDFFSKTDAYVILSYANQTQKSNTARNQGSNPSWNQKFMFQVEEGGSELTLKVMDEDLITADDHLGTATIPLAGVLNAGKVPPTAYNVVQSNGKFKGEIKVSLTFTPRRMPESSHGSGIYRTNASPYGPGQGSMEGSYGPGPYGPGPYGPGPYGGNMEGPYGSQPRTMEGPYGGGGRGGWNAGS